MTITLDQFRKQVRDRWRNEFALHRRALDIIEPAVTQPRRHDDHLALALDMLFVQAYKSHVSVRFLAELGHMEDTATITRRVLELSVFAGYITEPTVDSERVARADRYLANLWYELAPEGRVVLPTEVHGFWEALAPGVPRGGLPSFQAMFAALGKHETYKKDYDLLCGIAHGSSSDQLIAFAHQTVPVRPDWHLGTLLVFATKYALGVSILWNEIHKTMDETVLEELINDLVKWPEEKSASAAPPEAA